MKFPPVFLVTLVRLLRRDGFAFFGKCIRHALSPDAWVWLLRGGGGLAFAAAPEPPPAGAFVPPPDDATPEERAASRRVLREWRPQISVVVTSYNYGHVLRETLDALVAQTYPACEILVVDNGSSDGSPDIVREYAARFPSVRLLQHDGCANKGLPASVKLGAETATGEFVGFCEADDVWRADHLEKKVELLREHWGEPNLVVNLIETFGDPDLCLDFEQMMRRRETGLACIRNRISPAAFRKRNWICTFSIVLVRRSVLLGCDFLSVPRPSNLDWWLWRQICFDNDIWVVHEKLTKWRLHGDSYLNRDGTAERMADVLELLARMDRMLVERHPSQTYELLPYLRPEDRFCCNGGRLSFRGVAVQQPGFSLLLAPAGNEGDIRATVDSILAQSYGNYEIVLVGDTSSPAMQTAERLLREGGASAIRTVPSARTDPSAFPADALRAERHCREWVVPLLAGDRLRPDALKTFAGRAVCEPEATSIHAVAHGDRTGRRFVIPHPDDPEFQLACVGAFAFRSDGSLPSAFLSGLSRERPFPVGLCGDGSRFAEHVVLIRSEATPVEFPILEPSDGIREAGRGTVPEAETIRSSHWFEPAWLASRTSTAAGSAADAAERYLREGTDGRVSPGPDFVADEYLALNPDVAAIGANPLLHYERDGKAEGRPVSFLETVVRQPEGAAPVRRSLPPRPARLRRTAVFASHSSDGRVSERILFYLRGLAEVVDNVVFVASNPLLPGEADRLGELATEILAEPHDEYDFGSYRRGLRIARERGLLDPGAADELVLCNDSCYGPAFPFAEMFGTMHGRNCDFWGMTANEELGAWHLQSFFLVFRRRVLDGDALDRFLGGVVAVPGRGGVVLRYETALTETLRRAGFRPASFVPPDATPKETGVSPNPMLRPCLLLRRFRVPLVKVKAIDGEIEEPLDETLALLRETNPELSALVVSRPRNGQAESSRKWKWLRSLRESLPDSFPAKVVAIQAAAERGESIRCVFFVKDADEFPARPLFDAMSSDESRPFRPVVFVVPDHRSRRPESGMGRCLRTLSSSLPAGSVFEASRGEDGVWEDVLQGAAIAVYPPRPDETAFPYAPHWAVGRDFLPVLVPGDSSEVREEDAVRFWKASVDAQRLFADIAATFAENGVASPSVGSTTMQNRERR